MRKILHAFAGLFNPAFAAPTLSSAKHLSRDSADYAAENKPSEVTWDKPVNSGVIDQRTYPALPILITARPEGMSYEMYARLLRSQNNYIKRRKRRWFVHTGGTLIGSTKKLKPI